MEENKCNIRWDYDKRGKYWCGDRDYGDGVSSFIYIVRPVKNGYVAEATNNAFGAERVAVRNRYCANKSVFKNREKLMRDIENGKTYWLYTGFCNCVGKITKEEY